MKISSKKYFILPLIIFIGVIILLWRGLSLHPNEIPSPFINKTAPAIQLPTLFDAKQTLSNKDFLGHVTLLNVWATWCTACMAEHAFLLSLPHHKNFVIDGLNYKDDPTLAKKWLKENGNPYRLIALDLDGQTAIDWGVYGTPETFIIDKKGIIRYKQIGPINKNIWENTLQPLIQQLLEESPT